MQVPEGVTDFCTTYTDCAALYPDVMAKWDAFFEVCAVHTHNTNPQGDFNIAFL